MSLSTRSQLIYNISKYKLDSRIGKVLIDVKATTNFPGERVSVKPGYSPEIIDYRAYRHGDPIKDLDWKIYARTEQLAVKIREGHGRTEFAIAIDTSRSMKTTYSDNEPSKFISSLLLAYIAGRVALKAKDRVYIILNNNKFKVDSEQSLIDILSDIDVTNSDQNFWNTNIDFKSDIFVISDFFVDEQKYDIFLKNLLKNSDNIFLFVAQDKFEHSFDFNGRYQFMDPESDNQVLFSSYDLKENYKILYKKHFNEIIKHARLYGIKISEYLNTEDPFNFFIRAVL